MKYCYAYVWVPRVIAWYPNDTGLAPISVAIALAQPNVTSTSQPPGVTVDLFFSGEYLNSIYIGFQSLMTASSNLLEAAHIMGTTDDLPEAVDALQPAVPGESLVYEASSSINSYGNAYAYAFKGFFDIGQAYVVGQVAVINWTEQLWETFPYRILLSNGTWALGLMVTALRVVESGSVIAPAVYSWEAYDRCVNLSEWAYEQQVLTQAPSYFFGTGMNSTCPLPNTPAPVMWQDYATHLVEQGVYPPGTFPIIGYYEFQGYSSPQTPVGTALDVGSAVAGVVAAILWLVAPEYAVPASVIAALLNGVQVSSVSISQETMVSNVATEGYYTAVMFSNLTPTYVQGSYTYPLPRVMFYIVPLNSSG
ncbi:MAG: hypothetical protein ACP5HK_00970 [Acidilobus sp.]